jgi:hypothetical protein
MLVVLKKVTTLSMERHSSEGETLYKRIVRDVKKKNLPAYSGTPSCKLRATEEHWVRHPLLPECFHRLVVGHCAVVQGKEGKEDVRAGLSLEPIKGEIEAGG